MVGAWGNCSIRGLKMDDEEFLYACPSAVFFDNSITFDDMRMYMILYSIKDTSGVVYADSAWLANRIGFGIPYTKLCVKSLVSKGYVQFIKREGKANIKVVDLKVPYKIVSYPQ
jgi:hypothetical protein